MLLSVYIDAVTLARLKKASEETGRDVEQLAADGVSEYMSNGFRDRPDDDPAKDVKP